MCIYGKGYLRKYVDFNSYFLIVRIKINGWD